MEFESFADVGSPRVRAAKLNEGFDGLTGLWGGALPIAQDAEFIVASVEQGTTVTLPLPDGYGAYLYVASGQVSLGGKHMSAGDAAKITDEPEVAVEALAESELAMVVVQV